MENMTMGRYDLYMSHLTNDLSKDDDNQDGDREVVNTKEESGGEVSRDEIDKSKLADMINKGALGKKE